MTLFVVFFEEYEPMFLEDCQTSFLQSIVNVAEEKLA